MQCVSTLRAFVGLVHLKSGFRHSAAPVTTASAQDNCVSWLLIDKKKQHPQQDVLFFVYQQPYT